MLPLYSRCFELFFSLIILATSLDSAFGRNLAQRSVSMPAEPKLGEGVTSKITREMLFQWKNSPAKNVWEESGLFEGDIALKNVDRNGVTDEMKRWPNGVIPYKIDGNYSEDEQEQIKVIMEEYNNKTCIKFRPYQSEVDFISIRSDEPGCRSYVGRQYNSQLLNLQPDKCFTYGTIAHELLHVIGFWHQQSATNRDDHVSIKWDNIYDDKKHNFMKYSTSEIMDFNVLYDFNSIMHYGRQAFSKNNKDTIVPHVSHKQIHKNDKDTIVPHDPKAKIGQQHMLSEKDILKINKMYKCDEKQKDQTKP
uniref:Metalloendopeptidase n=1 Tax=Cacopsylla melanoneura TaxID=428564 RepID=A0A8D9F357_9HEMI